MSYVIPFHRTKFVPRSIPDNETSDTPVSFELSMAAGPDQARLKSILFATLGLANPTMASWSATIQSAVVEAFRMSPELFVNTVTRIDHLSAPAALCRKVALAVPEKAADDDAVPITTGLQFSRIAPYMSELALEVALEVQRLTHEGDLNPRFFKPSSGSRANATPTSGNATDAPATSDGDATAASAETTGSRRRHTSRRSS